MELSAVLTAFVVMTFASAAVAPLEWNVTNNSSLPAGAEAGGGTVSLCASPAWALLPSTCHCPKRRGDTTVICRGAALEAPPIKPPQGLIKLDLSNNSITELLPRAFAEYEQLEELNLSENRLLTLNRDAFVGCKVLKKLHMQKCGLLQVPTEALQPLRMLNTLNLGHNSLTTLEEDAFSELDHLAILLLKRNRISSIHDLALANLSALRVLELDDNLLREFPRALSTVSQLKELSISGNRIQRMDSDSLPRQLVLLDMRSTALSEVADDTFRHMTRLRNIVLSESRNLRALPNLTGARALEVLRVDRAGLEDTPYALCESCPKLKSLDLKSNRLNSLPNLAACQNLRVLDLSSNKIKDLDGTPFRNMGQLHDLLLAHNDIKSITKDDFIGLNKLQVLNMEGNKIEYIDPEAFVNFQQLEDLNLGNNMFAKLPSQGLQKLLHLKTFNNAKLKELPDPEHFPRIQSLILSYAYHCCAFLPIVAEVSVAKTNLQDSIIFPMPDMELDMNLWNSSQTDLWPQLQNLSNKFGSEITELWENFGSDFTYPVNLPTYVDEYFQEENMKTGSASAIPPGNIQCLPVPGPFLPCEDLFDWWSLRCGVWVVFLLSILGNGTVVFVLMFSRSKMDVPRFLVCNLAAADFFMGIYLGLLAVVDASTLGKFRMFAIPWQMSLGCQLAGFLAVLSSELSVYTLAVITLERNYAITHAMHLNKRLSLKHAGYIMTVGWMFALAMALLPLFGVSDYRKFAICLPFETTDRASLTYVVFLMFINGLAFLILMGCYLKMYCAIKGSHAWNSNDSRIAKRMALLVFTDFLCWSPIAFFSLTAVFGLQLISLEEAKVFAVFILPLNSCCNPFLYAILTKQFKKDCVLICKTIEESRVTRGIGRCRHSSNFSNRHTPANTNSLVERSSRDAPPLNAHTCGCAVKLLCDSAPQERKPQPLGLIDKARRYLCSARNSDTGSNRYAYQIAEIQQKQHKRTGSLSSDNFSSSRSNSWRQTRTHKCGIPLRLLDPRKRAASWIVTRKLSQDSNLSSSRNDSSGSATTASTSTWRVSRSSTGSATPATAAPEPRVKPRLVRQAAIQDEPSDTPRLALRALATIPSAAESSLQVDDDYNIGTFPEQNNAGAPFYAVMYGSGAPAALLAKDKRPTGIRQ